MFRTQKDEIINLYYFYIDSAIVGLSCILVLAVYNKHIQI